MKNKIKILWMAVLMAFPMLVTAQEKTLDFYYITHDYTTRVEDICDFLEERYEEAVEYDDVALIFYLPDGDYPTVFKMNVPGDNRQDFEDFLGELRGRNFHDSYVYVDLERVVEIFNEVDFIDETGEKKFRKVSMNWFITNEFWDKGNNEYLIAPVYYILEIDKYRDYVSFEIWNTGDDTVKANSLKPFGNRNLMGGRSLHILTL